VSGDPFGDPGDGFFAARQHLEDASFDGVGVMSTQVSRSLRENLARD